ncbi:MAG TPA: hypothetical protein VKA26_10440 [Ignavibacteriaceae bacterium]|nr:hypothetical protein [Ignavibacteriaceae bacterium]
MGLLAANKNEPIIYSGKFLTTLGNQSVSPKNNPDTLTDFENNSKGYFNFSGGAIKYLEPKQLANLKEIGLSFTADLNYKAGKNYSIGFLIGYTETNLKTNKYLQANNFVPGDSVMISGGKEYLLRYGIINRIFLIPSSPVDPLISIFIGYANMLSSEINIEAKSGVTKISDESRMGFTIGAGLGFFIHTGETAGFLLNADYNFFFYKNEKIKYGTASISYSLPIN